MNNKQKQNLQEKESNFDWDAWRSQASTQEFLAELSRRREVVLDRLPIIDDVNQPLKLGRKLGYIEALNDILAFGRGED